MGEILKHRCESKLSTLDVDRVPPAWTPVHRGPVAQYVYAEDDDGGSSVLDLCELHVKVFGDLVRPVTPPVPHVVDDDVKALVDRLVRRAKYDAFVTMINVAKGWDANDYVESFTLNDIRNMIDDAAREAGIYGMTFPSDDA